MHFTDTQFKAAHRAYSRDEIYRQRPPVTVKKPDSVTFTHDMFRAVPSGYGFCPRVPPVKVRRLDA